MAEIPEGWYSLKDREPTHVDTDPDSLVAVMDYAGNIRYAIACLDPVDDLKFYGWMIQCDPCEMLELTNEQFGDVMCWKPTGRTLDDIDEATVF